MGLIILSGFSQSFLKQPLMQMVSHYSGNLSECIGPAKISVDICAPLLQCLLNLDNT